MVIENFDQVHKLLSGYVPPARSFSGVYNLANATALMEFLGNPQDSYKVIHVAGTSGKTSTAYYLAAFLKAAGKKTGLTVSPHVDEVNERVQIDLVPLAEKEYCSELGQFLDVISTCKVKPTYFELLVAFAYWEFARQKVDYAIVEVGLGGLLDSTNVVHSADKVCVLTDIGLDHTHILGKTLPEIAAQKAGILQKGNQAFSFRQAPEITTVFEQRAEDVGVSLTFFDSQTYDKAADDLPVFQRRNWNLAHQTYVVLSPKRKLPKITGKKLTETTKTHIPARMEVVKRGKQILILDGAHNDQKLHALVLSIREKYPDKRASVLFSLKDGKDLDVSAVLKELLPICEQLIITGFGVQQDLPSHAIKPKDMVEVAQQLGMGNVQAIEDPLRAFKQLAKQKDDILLVAGSFYLLNQIRPLILKA